MPKVFLAKYKKDQEEIMELEKKNLIKNLKLEKEEEDEDSGRKLSTASFVLGFNK
jgi:hypothetical protein